MLCEVNKNTSLPCTVNIKQKTLHRNFCFAKTLLIRFAHYSLLIIRYWNHVLRSLKKPIFGICELEPGGVCWVCFLVKWSRRAHNSYTTYYFDFLCNDWRPTEWSVLSVVLFYTWLTNIFFAYDVKTFITSETRFSYLW